jgi:hypothetical protein
MTTVVATAFIIWLTHGMAWQLYGWGWIVIKEPSGGRVLISGNGGIHRSLQITLHHLHNKLEGM